MTINKSEMSQMSPEEKKIAKYGDEGQGEKLVSAKNKSNSSSRN
jgi:hypothetical protein